MRLQKLIFTALLLLAVSFQCSAENHARKVFMFGFAASFNDSTVYFTDIQEVDSVWLETKNKFLYSRDNYSYQLRDHLQNFGQEHPACMVVYAEKKKDVEKKYLKLRKRYISNKKGQHLYNIKYITVNDFQFKGILPDTEYQNNQNKVKKNKKK